MQSKQSKPLHVDNHGVRLRYLLSEFISCQDFEELPFNNHHGLN